MSQYDKINRLQAINKQAHLTLSLAHGALRNAKGDLEQADKVKAELEKLKREHFQLTEAVFDMSVIFGKFIEHCNGAEGMDFVQYQFAGDEHPLTDDDKRQLNDIRMIYLQSLTQKPVDNV